MVTPDHKGKGMGYPAAGKQFRRDVLMFLKEGVVEDT